MKEKAVLVIAALMIASMAYALSTTNVSAAHTPTVSIDDNLVKANTSMVLTITVNNAAVSEHAIDNVRIILEAGTGVAPTKKAPKENLVTLAPGNDNIVTLPAGTVVKLTGATVVKIPENTLMIRLKDDNVWREAAGVPDANRNVQLLENASVRARLADSTAGGLGELDNIKLVLPNAVTLENGLVRLIADTQVVLVSGDVMRLPDNTLVEPVADRNTVLGQGLEALDNIYLENTWSELTLTESRVRLVAAVKVYNPNTGEITLPVPAEENLQLISPFRVMVAKGTVVKLKENTTVTVYENTDVIRLVGENITAPVTENQPVNWTQTPGISDPLSTVPAVEWKGIGDNKIAAGTSLAFPFAVTTPNITTVTSYKIWVRTKDTAGVSKISELVLTVDGEVPTVTVTASPRWVKDNVAVTITVKASETLAKLENVMVAENNAPENTIVIMSSTDNITWTGTYTTGDNVLRDGTARIYVIGAQFEDLVGNKGSNVENTFTIDRLAPPKPNIAALTGFPVDNAAAPGIQTKIGSWTIEGTAEDNFLGAIENLENGTVKIRVGTTVYSVTATAAGYFYKSITLTEGTQEVGIQYIDLAGNVGPENAENVTHDATAPSISITSPAAGAIIKDNTPTITLTITDAVMGVENDNFSTADNSGYWVLLRRDSDNLVIAQLTPKVYPTEKQFKSYTFENDYPTELSEIWYNIFVQAGDNLQQENIYSRFKVDVTAPAEPSLITSYPTTTPDAPKVLKTTTITLSGTGGEPGATVKVYTSVSPFIVDTLATTTPTTITVGTDGTWSGSITVTAGVITRIRVSQVDVAGNESDKCLYGYVMADATAPVISAVTIDGKAPEEMKTTDKASCLIAGKVTDDVSGPTEITLRITYANVVMTLDLGVDGSFSMSVPLREGPNTISLVATDEAGNLSPATSLSVERTVAPWATYAIILVIVALILAAVAIFRKR